MKALGRRGILKGLLASPVAVPAAVEQLTAGQLGMGAMVGNAVSGECATAVARLKFTDFASWLRSGGEREARERAQHVSELDPELVGMRLPLPTKVRMQRQRNYDRMIAEKREWFERKLSLQGFVEDWF